MLSSKLWCVCGHGSQHLQLQLPRYLHGGGRCRLGSCWLQCRWTNGNLCIIRDAINTCTVWTCFYLQDNTDVIGCKVESDGNVSVVDTWNPTPRYSPNQIDDDGQIGVCTRFATYTNGRIRCLWVIVMFSLMCSHCVMCVCLFVWKQPESLRSSCRP